MKLYTTSKVKAPEPKGILDRYRSVSWGVQFFLRARWAWTPYAHMAALLPFHGKILDGGCGHGLLSLTLALTGSNREILGVDHSEGRVAIATAAAKGLPNLVFQTGDYSVLSGGPFDGIALIDVLHYLPYSKQEETLRQCFSYLRQGGTLLFREVDPGSGFTSRFNRIHEKIMTGLGFTRAPGLHFRDRGAWEGLARRAGFTVRFRPFTRFPFADILFECRKP